MIVALALLSQLSIGDWPKDTSAAPKENPTLGPLEVCEAMTKAVKDGDMDALVGHCTAYGRSRFNEKAKVALKGLHSLLVGVRCVRLDHEDDKSDPPHALIWIYAPEGKSRDMPFVKENGFWRYDQQTYEQMNKKK
ncbi:MAG: hypothetical protein JST54_34910 [Deltaproteobacteria bacterium]|nr:hypothetical protein [Deltaproteobacteria bacterium]